MRAISDPHDEGDGESKSSSPDVSPAAVTSAVSSSAVPRKSIKPASNRDLFLESLRPVPDEVRAWARERVAVGRFRGGRALHNAIYAIDDSRRRPFNVSSRAAVRVQALVEAGADVNFVADGVLYDTYATYQNWTSRLLRVPKDEGDDGEGAMIPAPGGGWYLEKRTHRVLTDLSPLHLAVSKPYASEWLVQILATRPELDLHARCNGAPVADGGWADDAGWTPLHLANHLGKPLPSAANGWPTNHSGGSKPLRALLAAGANPLVKCTGRGNMVREMKAYRPEVETHVRPKGALRSEDGECYADLRAHVAGLIRCGEYYRSLAHAKSLEPGIEPGKDDDG